jgi:surface antigen
MNSLLNKALVLCASIMLTACSMLKENETTPAGSHKPVIVENAQESIKNNSEQPTKIMEQQPKDQNTLQSVNLGSTSTNNEPVGGSMEKSMDQDDKIKMSKALDKAPGKTTSWTNNRTNMHYEVTPIKKVVLKNNPFCRTYKMLSSRGEYVNQVSGTACISEDGNWHPVL